MKEVVYYFISFTFFIQCIYTEIKNCRSQPSKNIFTTVKSTNKQTEILSKGSIFGIKPKLKSAVATQLRVFYLSDHNRNFYTSVTPDIPPAHYIVRPHMQFSVQKLLQRSVTNRCDQCYFPQLCAERTPCHSLSDITKLPESSTNPCQYNNPFHSVSKYIYIFNTIMVRMVRPTDNEVNEPTVSFIAILNPWNISGNYFTAAIRISVFMP